MAKYPHCVQKLLHYTTHEDGRRIDFRQTSISEADYTANNLSTARRLSAYMSLRSLATNTTSSFLGIFRNSSLLK